MLTGGSVTVIAEAGVNHGGDLVVARELIDAAAAAGADIVKFQTFTADLIISPAAEKAAYQQDATGGDESQLEMVRRLELDGDDHDQLIAHCRSRNIGFLSTPFDGPSIELLRSRGVALGKIPSGEVTNRPHLEQMAGAFDDLIMSTGMCTLAEIGAAVDVLVDAGADRGRVTLLHCNTAYPTPIADVNLRAMGAIADSFGLPVGYSDHTLGWDVPIAAVALGATVIEKHITLDRSLPGPDQAASLEPDELVAMVRSIRNVETSLGHTEKRPTPSERANIVAARKSIHLARPVARNHALHRDDLIMLRPGDGISPFRLDDVVGRVAARDLAALTMLDLADLR